MNDEMTERLDKTLEEVRAIYDQGKDTGLSAFGCGVLAGINQALLWVLGPDDWAEPLSTIPGLELISDKANIGTQQNHEEPNEPTSDNRL